MNDEPTPPQVETFHDLEYSLQCAIADWGGEWVGKLLNRGWSSDAILELIRKYRKGIGRPYLGHSDKFILADIARIGRGEPAPVPATGIDEHLLPITFFMDQKAATQMCEVATLPALAGLIRRITKASKQELPWLKLGTFGDTKSDKNCLRTNANMIEISGIEGDHDSGKLLFEEAIKIMRAANIRCLFYTSASFIPGEKEKWRILVPLFEAVRDGRAVRLRRQVEWPARWSPSRRKLHDVAVLLLRQRQQ